MAKKDITIEELQGWIRADDLNQLKSHIKQISSMQSSLFSPLHFFIENNASQDAINLLVLENKDCLETLYQYQSPLYLAALKDRFDIALYLISKLIENKEKATGKLYLDVLTLLKSKEKSSEAVSAVIKNLDIYRRDMVFIKAAFSMRNVYFKQTSLPENDKDQIRDIIFSQLQQNEELWKIAELYEEKEKIELFIRSLAEKLSSQLKGNMKVANEHNKDNFKNQLRAHRGSAGSPISINYRALAAELNNEFLRQDITSVPTGVPPGFFIQDDITAKFGKTYQPFTNRFYDVLAQLFGVSKDIYNEKLVDANNNNVSDALDKQNKIQTGAKAAEVGLKVAGEGAGALDFIPGLAGLGKALKSVLKGAGAGIGSVVTWGGTTFQKWLVDYKNTKDKKLAATVLVSLKRVNNGMMEPLGEIAGSDCEFDSEAIKRVALTMAKYLSGVMDTLKMDGSQQERLAEKCAEIMMQGIFQEKYFHVEKDSVFEAFVNYFDKQKDKVRNGLFERAIMILFSHHWKNEQAETSFRINRQEVPLSQVIRESGFKVEGADNTSSLYTKDGVESKHGYRLLSEEEWNMLFPTKKFSRVIASSETIENTVPIKILHLDDAFDDGVKAVIMEYNQHHVRLWNEKSFPKLMVSLALLESFNKPTLMSHEAFKKSFEENFNQLKYIANFFTEEEKKKANNSIEKLKSMSEQKNLNDTRQMPALTPLSDATEFNIKSESNQTKTYRYAGYAATLVSFGAVLGGTSVYAWYKLSSFAGAASFAGAQTTDLVAKIPVNGALSGTAKYSASFLARVSSIAINVVNSAYTTVKEIAYGADDNKAEKVEESEYSPFVEKFLEDCENLQTKEISTLDRAISFCNELINHSDPSEFLLGKESNFAIPNKINLFIFPDRYPSLSSEQEDLLTKAKDIIFKIKDQKIITLGKEEDVFIFNKKIDNLFNDVDLSRLDISFQKLIVQLYQYYLTISYYHKNFTPESRNALVIQYANIMIYVIRYSSEYAQSWAQKHIWQLENDFKKVLYSVFSDMNDDEKDLLCAAIFEIFQIKEFDAKFDAILKEKIDAVNAAESERNTQLIVESGMTGISIFLSALSLFGGPITWGPGLLLGASTLSSSAQVGLTAGLHASEKEDRKKMFEEKLNKILEKNKEMDALIKDIVALDDKQIEWKSVAYDFCRAFLVNNLEEEGALLRSILLDNVITLKQALIDQALFHDKERMLAQWVKEIEMRKPSQPLGAIESIAIKFGLLSYDPVRQGHAPLPLLLTY